MLIQLLYIFFKDLAMKIFVKWCIGATFACWRCNYWWNFVIWIILNIGGL